MPLNLVSELKAGKCQPANDATKPADFALCPSWKKS
jgi:hypothetical protein